MKRLTEETVFSGLVTAWFFSSLADHALAVLAKTFDGRRGAIALGVHENFGLGTLHDSHGGIGRTQGRCPESCPYDLLPLTSELCNRNQVLRLGSRGLAFFQRFVL